MDAFEGLTKDPKWQAACELARLLIRLHTEASASAAADTSNLEALLLAARSIPRALAEAHIAAHAQTRVTHLRGAVEECRRVEGLVMEWVENLPDAYPHVIEAFMRADALREMIFLATLEERELRETA